MASQPGEKNCHPFAVCLASCYPPFFDWHQATGSPIVRLPISLQHKSEPDEEVGHNNHLQNRTEGIQNQVLGRGHPKLESKTQRRHTRRAGRSRKAEGPATSLWLRFIFFYFLESGTVFLCSQVSQIIIKFEAQELALLLAVR